jgi:two-component system sensor histidine kinase YesM
MDSVSSVVQADKAVNDYLYAEEYSTASEEAKEQAALILKAMTDARNDISLIAIINNKGGIITSDNEAELNPFTNVKKQSWYVNAKNNRGASAVSPSHVQNIIAGSYPWVISLSREIIDDNGRDLGVLLVDLNYRIIKSICESVELGHRGYIFIVDRNGDIVYHPRQQLLYSGLKSENIQRIIDESDDYFAGEPSTGNDEDRDKFYSVQTMNSTGWKVAEVNYRSEFAENRETIRTTYAVWGLMFLAAAMGMSVFIIWEIRNLLKRVTSEEGQKRKSELKALQMQINPHFLYNTLDSVIWMAQGGKQDEVIAMSSALARLFRLSISKGREIIDVASELEHVRNYLTIQKIRYKDRLDYRIEVDQELMSLKIVKIILQPLVENAIYHGIKNKSSAGTVLISGSLCPGGMTLSVHDDGIGMDRETLAGIREGLINPRANSAKSHRGSGVGLHNVDERIKLYFGREYGLEFDSSEEKGTTVTIRLPAVRGEIEA